MVKVLNFGSLNIDMVYKVSHTVRPGETLASRGLSFHAGGKGANQSAALAKAGAQVFHAGKVGKDGEWLLERLGEYGVNTDHIRVDECKTGHALIQLSDNGENAIVLFGGGNRLIRAEEIDSVLACFSKQDILLLQNEINGVADLMNKASLKGMAIYFNPAPFTEEVLSYPLEKVDTLIVNETEGSGLAQGEKDVEKMMSVLTGKYREQKILLTLGKAGAVFGRREFRASSGILEVPVKDTTAAGDAFTGYFVAQIISGQTVEKALETASIAAAVTVSRLGAMESIPYRKELFRYLG